MMASYSLDDFDPNNTFGNSTPVPEGWYHVQLVDGTSESHVKGTKHKFIWQIIGSQPTHVAAAGRKITEYLYDWTPVYAKIFIRIGIATGAYTIEEIKSLKDKGENITEPDFSQWCGRTCAVKVFHEKDKEKPEKVYAKIGFNYFPLDNDEVKESGLLLNNAFELAAKDNDDPF